MTKFNVGDVVQLVSGGPQMTVSKVYDNGTTTCQWFGGKKLEGGNFPQESLIIVPIAKD